MLCTYNILSNSRHIYVRFHSRVCPFIDHLSFFVNIQLFFWESSFVCPSNNFLLKCNWSFWNGRHAILIPMFGIDIFMVLGIVQPKSCEQKDISIKNRKKHIIKGEREKKGEGGKRVKGKGAKHINKYLNKVKCYQFYTLLNLCSAILRNVTIACLEIPKS